MKHCTSCGAERKAGTRFCVECGAAFGDAETIPEAPQAPPAARPSATAARLPRQLRCVECASPIDAGLVCARCASVAANSAMAALSTPTPSAASGPPNPSAPAVRNAPPQVVVATPAPPQRRSQANGTSSGHAATPWSVGASVAFIAFCLTTAHISPFAFVLAGAGLAVAAVAGLVAAAIWGRAAAQAWFSGLLCLTFAALLYIRVLAKPELGVNYQSTAAGALIVVVDPDGPLGQLGWKAPTLVQSVDGVEVGYGKAELSSVIASKRALDRVNITASTPEHLIPRAFEVTLFDR